MLFEDKPAVGYQAANQTNDVFGQRRSLGSSRVVFPSSSLKSPLAFCKVKGGEDAYLLRPCYM
jgi:hypothetical protein